MDAEPRPREPVVVEAHHRVGWPQGQISRVLDRGRSGSVVDWRPEGERSWSPGVPDGAEDVDVPAVDVEGGIEAADDGVPQHSDHLHLISEPEAAHAELHVAELLDIFQPDSFGSENSKATSPRNESEFSSQTFQNAWRLQRFGAIPSENFVYIVLTREIKYQ